MTTSSSAPIKNALLIAGLLLIGACSAYVDDSPEAARIDGEDGNLGAGGTAGSLRRQATGGFAGETGGPVTTVVDVAYNNSLTGESEAGANGNYSFLQAGDTANNKLLYGGMTFQLPTLPASAVVTSALVRMQVSNVEGNPYDNVLGDYVLDKVFFTTRGTIDNPTVVIPAFTKLIPNSATVAPGSPVWATVTSLIANAYAAGETRIQFRVRPTGVAKANGVADRISIRRVANESAAMVAAGVTNPDPNNYLMLRITYQTP